MEINIMTTDNTTDFNITNRHYYVSDVDEVLIDVDVAYNNALHRVSFCRKLDDENKIEEVINEFMEEVNKGLHDDAFYEQLESDWTDTRVYGPYIGKSQTHLELLPDELPSTLVVWNSLMPIERNAYREKNRLHNLAGNYGRKMNKEYIPALMR